MVELDLRKTDITLALGRHASLGADVLYFTA